MHSTLVILRSASCDEGPMHLAGAIAAVNNLHRSFGPQRTRASG